MIEDYLFKARFVRCSLQLTPDLPLVLEGPQWKFSSQATTYERFYKENLMNNLVKSNSFNTDIEEALESVGIKRD